MSEEKPDPSRAWGLKHTALATILATAGQFYAATEIIYTRREGVALEERLKETKTDTSKINDDLRETIKAMSNNLNKIVIDVAVIKNEIKKKPFEGPSESDGNSVSQNAEENGLRVED